MIGKTIVLWKEEFSNRAYQDQMGIWQGGYVVKNEYVVTIIETQKVRGMWGNSEYDGWKAITNDGQVFTCNWNNFPDDSIAPTYYWDVVNSNGELWMPVDAIQAARVYPHVDENGDKKFPIGSSECRKHNVLFLNKCWYCEHDEITGRK